eukprot:TRINITY_DN38523_c0_g1_i1.p1 TRINITY_DN38523_c0_g1~~TRINITY_DN38523_c0_g1_i1.p1  ORF type:complete len:153 (+),score=19.76 TRINITY_DN38523_c0_g1_i1:65-523(+)
MSQILSTPRLCKSSFTRTPILLRKPTVTTRQRSVHIVYAEDTKGPEKALEITDKNWESEVEKSNIPVLIDFWAPWCGPCRMISPLMDELTDEYNGKVKVTKVNTDEVPSIATKLGIRSIPTVMLYKDGQKRETVIGAVPKKNLVDILDKYLE